jgi:hypothetical protein
MTNDDKQMKILRSFEHGEIPIDDADYDKEFPLTDHPHKGSGCGTTCDVAQFMALQLPDDGKPVWTYPSHTVEFASRNCGTPGCNNRLGRRA